MVVSEKKGVYVKYIYMIKDIYNEAIISVRITGGNNNKFPIIICLH